MSSARCIKLLFGVLLIAPLTAMAGCTSTSSSAPQKVARTTVGRPLALVGLSGLVRATVYSVDYNVPGPEAFIAPDPGTEYIVAEVQVCAGSHGYRVTPTIFVPINFTVALASGMVDTMITDSPTSPFVDDAVHVMRPNQCIVAYAPFEEPKGSIVTSVGEGDADTPDYIWSLPNGPKA